jgi:hypothetical protein
MMNAPKEVVIEGKNVLGERTGQGRNLVGFPARCGGMMADGPSAFHDENR